METRNILTREKKTRSDFQLFPCFCRNQVFVSDLWWVPDCDVGWEGWRYAADCWWRWWWKFPDTTDPGPDSRLQILMIRNNYPGMNPITSQPILGSHLVFCLGCSSSSLHPQPLITALMTVSVCLSSSGSWLIIWSLTHYQTQTSSLLRGFRLQTAEEESLFACSRVYEVSVTSLPSNLCPPVINIHCLHHVQISVSNSRLPPVTAPGYGDTNMMFKPSQWSRGLISQWVTAMLTG